MRVLFGELHPSPESSLWCQGAGLVTYQTSFVAPFECLHGESSGFTKREHFSHCANSTKNPGQECIIYLKASIVCRYKFLVFLAKVA